MSAQSMSPAVGLAPARDQDTSGSSSGIGSAMGGLAGMMGNAGLMGMMSGPDAFSPVLNAALSACFGDISGIDVSTGRDAAVGAVGADATTTGRKIDLGSTVSPDLSDPFSMEVIGHEMAHALNGGGTGEHAVDRPGDRGEVNADHAGARFRDFVMGGMRGPAPTIAPASGGRARVHRWESGEHVHAVDDTVNASGTSAGAQNQLNQKIVLANGHELTPGEVTALMGDYYGVVDPNTHQLDPVASMQQLQNADPEEMGRILGHVRNEVAGGEEASPADLEWITRRRGEHQSYLEMAQMNDSHFSAADSTGLDNNMGCYNDLHRRALEAAQGGDANTARLYEGMAMHYLTDRHSAGHNFNKQEAMNQSGHDQDSDGSDGVLRNMYAKLAHDDFNENGADMHNANGDEFRAYGDGHWDDERNADNRDATHRSVATSYDELDAVLSGRQTAEELGNRGYNANNTVPEFDQSNQDRANGIVRNANVGSLLWKYAGNLPGAVGGALARYEGQAENWVVDKWDRATDWVGGAWNTATDWVGGAWNTATDWAGGAWNTATDWVGGAWDSTTDWVGGAWNTATDTVSDGWNTATDWIGNTASDAAEWGQGAWNTGTDAVASGWNTATDAVSEGWGAATDTVSEGWGAATDGISSGWSSATDWLGL